MNTRMITAIIVRRLDRAVITIELTEICDNLSEFYRIIDCSHIDIVQRVFNDRIFDIVLDDEGLLKANEKGDLPTSWWQNENFTPNHEGLFGVLILCHCDNEGNLTSATAEDLLAVEQCYHVIPTNKGDLALLFHDINLD